MNLQISRIDLVIAAMLGVVFTFLSGHFAPAARTVEAQPILEVVIPAQTRTLMHDPDAGAMNAEPDRNNWGPEDGQSRYSDRNAPDSDQNDDDDMDSSYDPPDTPDTTPI